MIKKPAFIFQLISAASATLLFPVLAYAHEVYVLTPGQINSDVNRPGFDMVATASQHLPQLLEWACIVVVSVVAIFIIANFRWLAKLMKPLLYEAKKYAPFIARITIGISFLACAYYQATYGPELPLKNSFGSFSFLATIAFILIGMIVIIGLWVRAAAFMALCMFLITTWFYHSYMITYVNYLGEIIVLLILGAHNWSIDRWLEKRQAKTQSLLFIPVSMQKAIDYLKPRSFAILRILFGIALIYASAYAKIIHNNLALDTVNDYHLDKILGFEPHFLVLGAALIELLIGIFFILGFEIRFTALFLLFWLTLSLIFFGEVVWPHLILIGIPIAYLFHGYDQWSLGGWLANKKQYEPVL